jgi:hypothetical protein
MIIHMLHLLDHPPIMITQLAHILTISITIIHQLELFLLLTLLVPAIIDHTTELNKVTSYSNIDNILRK